jgi:TetR/AcrR family transcriptional regulator
MSPRSAPAAVQPHPEGLPHWAERAVERSPGVRRTPERSLEQAKAIVAAANELVAARGAEFTTQELVAEAGVSLQTFYKAFASKDELLLAVLEDRIASSCEAYAAATASLPPLDRLEAYVGVALAAPTSAGAEARFITAEHWRLMQDYPAEVEAATRPFTELVEASLRQAVAEGSLDVEAPDEAAWLITQLVMSVFHHRACSGSAGASAAGLWAFCLAALGGR